MMKKAIMYLGVCVFLLASCQPKKHHTEEKSKLSVTQPLVKDTILSNEYVAQIQSIRNIEIRVMEKGYLNHIYVDEGDFVKKGQLLFGIMPRLYEAEQQKAKAEADFARIEYENTKVLADSNVVAPNELAMAKAHYDRAKAELALANVHLDFTSIKAPFDGIVDRLHMKLGSFVEEGELLTTLSDNSEMWVYFNVPEAEYLEYKSNMRAKDKEQVSLLMANNRTYPHSGIVETIEGEFNNETGNIAFRATFPNPDGLLRHGETGSVITKLPYKNAMIIPQKATFEVLDKEYVYLVTEEGKIQATEIKIESELPHLFIVKEGLKEDDKILLDGLRKVRDGDEIEYELEDSEEVLAHLELYAE